MFSERSRFDRRKNAITLAVEAAEREGRALLDLTLSNPTRAELPYPSEEILAAIADPRALRYDPEPLGLAPAREAVAREYAARGLTVSAERVALTASTSEAYSVLIKLLCDPGDELLVPAPSYPLFEQLAAFEGVRLSPYRLAYDGSWHLDRSSLEKARSPASRAVVVVSPNNPTGSYLKRDELEAVAELGLPIVSDEVFAGYPLRADRTRVESALSAGATNLVFALGGLSKRLLLPQLKLAWTIVAGPDALVGEALGRLELILDAYLSPGAAVMHALPRLFDASHAVKAALDRRISENLALLRERARGSALTLLDVEGGWYALLRLPATLDDEGWVLDLISSSAVLTQPGYFYDFSETEFVVVSLITPAATFEQGVSRLVARVEAIG
jgi:alanine-synthesizing transaminase